MDINIARTIVILQNRRIASLNGKRFSHKGWEYEIRYEGGFATFVSLYRRQIGRRNFKYFTGKGCWDCIDAKSALDKLLKHLPEVSVEEVLA